MGITVKEGICPHFYLKSTLKPDEPFLQDTSKSSSNYTYGYSRFAIFSYNLWKILKEAKSIRLGRDGERAVGQFL